MKQLLLPVLSLLLLASCKGKDKASTAQKEPEKKTAIDSTLVTDSSWGAITKTTDLEGLKQLFGAGALADARICGPECADSIDVTFINRGSNREICVYWKDSAYHKAIGMLECGDEPSVYHTAGGIRIGSTLADLLKLNGKKISFSGFGWDYGGNIQSFNGGTLDKTSILYHLNLTESSNNNLYGERQLDTDMPDVQKEINKMLVNQISLTFFP